MNRILRSPTPENLLDTQSMILDDGVSDTQLAEVLIRVHGDELTWLAMVMLLTGQPALPEPYQPAREIVIDALVQVVVHRDRIWEHPSLRAWLIHLVLHGCRLREQQERTRQRVRLGLAAQEFILKLRRRLGWLKEEIKEAHPPSPLQIAWSKMARREQQTMLLHVVFGLSRAEIASAVEADPYPVEYWIKESRRKISTALIKHPVPGLSLSRNPEERENSLINALRQLWPVPGLNLEDSRLYTARIETRGQALRGRRRSFIASREAALVGLVLAALFFTCRAADLLPEEIIHQYKTPTSFAKYALPMDLPTPDAPFYYDYSIQEGDTLESISQKAGVHPQDIRSLNQYNRFEAANGLVAGTTIKLPASPAMDWRVMPTPVTPAPPLLPLTLQSDPQTILERIQASATTWRTLWMSVQEISYGPPGYLGPPLNLYGEQVWISQPGRFWLIGQSSSEGSVTFQFIFLNGVYFDRIPGANSIYGNFSEENIALFLSYLLSGRNPIHENTLKVLREEQVAGRQALVVQATRPGSPEISRLWIDALTGVILRRLDYSQDAPDIVIQERQVIAIAYDRDFPASIFNPTASSQASFVQDYTGQPLPHGENFPWQPGWLENGHAPRPVLPAPPGFDPSGQPVYLQWPESRKQAMWKPPLRANTPPAPQGSAVPGPVGANTLTPEPGIDVFASRYSLGSLPLKDVSFNACQRSPDGQTIALSVNNGEPGYSQSQLVWFRLDSPNELHHLSGYWGGPFAFSPDSRRLAYDACEGGWNCSIRVEELDTSQAQTLNVDRDVISMTWSPDGQSLALVDYAFDQSPKYFLMVLDLQSWTVIYVGKYDPESGILPADSPTHDWGMEIPISSQNAQGCMLPFPYPKAK